MIQPGFVETERVGRILRVTVARPEAMNAASSAVVDELAASLALAAADGDVRAVVLSGAGDRAFISGGDVREMRDMSSIGAREYSRKGHHLTRMIEEMDKPVIAALNGVALGGGCEIALACDIRIAAQHARLGQPEVRLGIIPGWGGTFRLARLVGEGLARELIFTARLVTAEEALRIGLVNRVVLSERLVDEATRMASEIAEMAPLAVAAAKRSMYLGRHMDGPSAAEIEGGLFAEGFDTEDRREGLTAFLEKRPALFVGR